MRPIIAAVTLQVLSAAAGPAASLDALELLQTVHLQAETHHVQGIEIQDNRLWVTSVDVRNKKGLLLEFRLPDGKLNRSIELQDGSRYHPGGISADSTSLWIPIAEYRPQSTSLIEKRNKSTLALEHRFSVQDHIGCIAVTPDFLVGGNWDARHLYVWDHRGKLIRKVPNPSGNAFQDLKFRDRKLVGGGLLADKSGAIDWLEFPSLMSVRRLTTAKTDRGVVYTHEGMTLLGDKLYLLPEDGPSRLFVFRMPD